MSLEATDGVAGPRPGRSRFVPGAIRRGDPTEGPSLASSTADLVTALLIEIRDDLGFDTVSLYARSSDEWRLLERIGPERPWHAVIDPAVFDTTSEAVEYPDVRAIPGIGPRLAGLGCASVAMLPLPGGATLMFDGEGPGGVGGWVERARPYLALISIMAGRGWGTGWSPDGQDEDATLDRLFVACQEALMRASATIDEVLEAAQAALHADELFLITDAGSTLRVLTPNTGPYPQRLAGQTWLSSDASDEALDDSALRTLALALGMSSRVLGGAYGRRMEHPEILVAGWATGPALSGPSMRLAARIVSTARTAVQGRRLAVTSLLDREKARMAYALHDGLTQTVTGAILEMEALAKRIERDPTDALEVLENSKSEIRKALAELRGMLFDLSPAPEDHRPAEALTSYVDDVVKRWRLPARVAVEGDLSSIPARVLSVAYVVIREALANAAKHAAGRNVTVTLSAGHDDLTVIVGDGGRGFTHQDELAAREANHIGLDMLRRRVGEVGGKLRVESRPGKGTRVIAQLPIREVAS